MFQKAKIMIVNVVILQGKLKRVKVAYQSIYDFAKAVYSYESHARILQSWREYQSRDDNLKDFWDGDIMMHEVCLIISIRYI